MFGRHDGEKEKPVKETAHYGGKNDGFDGRE